MSDALVEPSRPETVPLVVTSNGQQQTLADSSTLTQQMAPRPPTQARAKTALGICSARHAARYKSVGTESLYGWYPPAEEPTKIVPRKPLLNSYERELLFKFWRSRYAHNAQRQRAADAAAGNGGSAHSNAVTTAVQTRPPVRLFSIPGECKTIEVPITQREDPREFTITVTGQKAKLFAPFQHLRVNNRKEEAASPKTRNRPFTAPPGLKTTALAVEGVSLQPSTPEAPREAVKIPTRPKSAFSGPVVHESESPASPADVSATNCKCKNARRAKSAMTVRSRTPHDGNTADDEEITIQMPKTYEEAKKLFGWRFEVHNDPLGIKRPYAAKRLSYVLPCTEPQVLPLAPKATFTNHDTFFSTTVPRVQYSFSIAPDFSSEVYNRKREEMQKRGNWNYRHREYSFLY